MTAPSMIDLLVARRDLLIAQQDALVASGDQSAAEDMEALVRFAIRQANDALMGRCS